MKLIFKAYYNLQNDSFIQCYKSQNTIQIVLLTIIKEYIKTNKNNIDACASISAYRVCYILVWFIYHLWL
jgi:hypothetical protein